MDEATLAIFPHKGPPVSTTELPRWQNCVDKQKNIVSYQGKSIYVTLFHAM